MRRIQFLSIFTLFLAVTVLPVTALGGTIFRASGQNASAAFTVPDPSNPTCIFMAAYVSANQTTDKNPPGPGSSETSASVAILKYDACLGGYLVDAYADGAIPDQDFTITPSSASLKTTLEVTDWVTGASFPVMIDVTWAATGPVERQNRHDHFSSAHNKQLYLLTGAYRPAEATGTVYVGTTNFAPEPSMSADFGRGRVMRLSIGEEPIPFR